MADYQKLRADKKLSGTIKAAEAKRSARQSNKPHTFRRVENWQKWRFIQIGANLRQFGESEAKKLEPKKRVFHVIPTLNRRRIDNRVHVHTSFEKYGRKTYSRHSNNYYVLARGYACKKHLIATIGEKFYRIRARKNYVFGMDDNGIYIANEKTARDPERQYHPDSDEIAGGNTTMIAALKAHILKRAEVKRKASGKLSPKFRRALKLAESVGIYVCARDSYSAGNCRYGTLAWGQHQGLTSKKHYPLRMIERLRGTSSLVERVIEQAKNRAMREMSEGVCWLADHKN